MAASVLIPVKAHFLATEEVEGKMHHHLRSVIESLHDANHDLDGDDEYNKNIKGNIDDLNDEDKEEILQKILWLLKKNYKAKEHHDLINNPLYSTARLYFIKNPQALDSYRNYLKAKNISNKEYLLQREFEKPGVKRKLQELRKVMFSINRGIDRQSNLEESDQLNDQNHRINTLETVRAITDEDIEEKTERKLPVDTLELHMREHENEAESRMEKTKREEGTWERKEEKLENDGGKLKVKKGSANKRWDETNEENVREQWEKGREKIKWQEERARERWEDGKSKRQREKGVVEQELKQGITREPWKGSRLEKQGKERRAKEQLEEGSARDQWEGRYAQEQWDDRNARKQSKEIRPKKQESEVRTSQDWEEGEDKKWQEKRIRKQREEGKWQEKNARELQDEGNWQEKSAREQRDEGKWQEKSTKEQREEGNAKETLEEGIESENVVHHKLDTKRSDHNYNREMGNGNIYKSSREVNKRIDDWVKITTQPWTTREYKKKKPDPNESDRKISYRKPKSVARLRDNFGMHGRTSIPYVGKKGIFEDD